VTVGQFHGFTDSGAYRRAFGREFDWAKNRPAFEQSPDHPMVNVDWYEAKAYCHWAGGELPTEAQWEHAARGFSGLTYPWGTDWKTDVLHWSATKPGAARGTAPVESHKTGASPYGCLDMEGNVAQWCRDGYQPDISTATDNPVGSGTSMVVRGQPWSQNTPAAFHAAVRTSVDPKTHAKIDPHMRFDTVGFRYVELP
jgi:formylglycine-generating enzyme required for sulfatase activity